MKLVNSVLFLEGEDLTELQSTTLDLLMSMNFSLHLVSSRGHSSVRLHHSRHSLPSRTHSAHQVSVLLAVSRWGLGLTQWIAYLCHPYIQGDMLQLLPALSFLRGTISSIRQVLGHLLVIRFTQPLEGMRMLDREILLLRVTFLNLILPPPPHRKCRCLQVEVLLCQ